MNEAMDKAEIRDLEMQDQIRDQIESRNHKAAENLNEPFADRIVKSASGKRIK